MTQSNVIRLEERLRPANARASEPLLSVSGLRIATADGRELVHDISFDLPRSGTIGIVGESGSGKSLTCRAILGVLPKGIEVTSGAIRYGETDLSRLDRKGWAPLRGVDIGAVFQDPGSYLNPSIPIGRQIRETLSATLRLSRADAQARALSLLSRVGFPHPQAVYGQYPFELSGGMVQRALIAIAVCADPALLIADEATTALDVTVQAEVLRLIADLRRERDLALIMVSHDLAVVSQVCDHVLVMRDGAVLESGPTREVLRRPQHGYTRSLVDMHRHYALEATTRVKRRAVHAPAAKAPLLRLSGVEVGYGDKTVLNGIDLDLQGGEILGLIGETGSGKTTLLRSILGLARPSRGTISLDGEDIGGLTGKRLRAFRRSSQLQYVFQDPLRSLDPDQSIEASVGEGIDIRGQLNSWEKDGKIIDALQAVGLDPALRKRLPGNLSGGQRQRAVIARALALDPQVMLLDEPVSALDAVSRMTILELLKSLARERGIAQIFISHDLGSIAGIADRVAVLHNGAIVEVGPTHGILTRPQHPYTRALIAAAPRIAPAKDALDERQFLPVHP